MPKKTVITSVVLSAEDVEKALRTAFNIPTEAEISFDVDMEDQPGDYRAALPLMPVFQGVSYEISESEEDR